MFITILDLKKLALVILICPLFSFSQWTQVGDDIDGEFPNDNSGSKTVISSDGSIVAVAATSNTNATGHVRVFENNNDVWLQLGSDIDGQGQAFRTGSSLSLSNNGLIVATGARLFGTPETPSRGHVQVFEFTSGDWVQIGNDILGLNANDQLGEAVSLNGNGNIVAVGANFNTTGGPTFAGYVNVYENINGTWTQIGSTIYGEATGDLSGTSISLNDAGNILAIGAPNNIGNNNPNSGHVRVYENINGVWTQIGNDIDGEASMDGFGRSVSLNNNGNILAVGADANDGVNGTSSGHVRVFENVNGNWVQIGNDIDGEASLDFFGVSVCLNGEGDLLVVGAPLNDAEGNGDNYGHTRVFEYDNNDWIQIGDDIDGEAANDGSGVSVSMSNSGATLAIGANFNDGNGNNSGHVRVYNNPLLSVNEFNFANQVKLYPNPSYGDSYLDLGANYNDINLNIYDSLGRVVSSDTYNFTKKIRINTNSLADKGVYHIHVKADRKSIVLKLITSR